jgi:excinuclease ABC subunit C
MAQELSFRPQTGEIPTQPGVYRFLDSNGRVLYVGKAKNLRARLTNYFGPLDSLHERTRRMVTSAADVKWVIVKTEFEALQLEFMWIKQFDPPFNVRFKDDKSYPYLALSVAEKVPRAFITRNRELKGVKFFGPYTQAWAVRETLDTLLKVYPVRSCTQGVYQAAKRNNRPCLLGDIGKCAAPCVDRVSASEYQQIVKSFGDFMSGGDNKHVEALRKRMLKASDEQQFELAAQLRDGVTALETVLAKSAIVFTDNTDADVFGISDDDLAAAVSQFIVRGGRIRGVRGWVVDKELERDLGELVEYVLQNVYEPKDGTEPIEVPKEVLVPQLPEDAGDLSTWLSQLRGSKVDLRIPQRGDKLALAKTAETNAKHALLLYRNRRTADFTARADALAAIQSALDMPDAPLRIECFDVSHLSGTNVVASMVVFEDGLPKKDHYRRFNIEQTTDDTDSIFQVLSRRLAYLREDAVTVAGGEPEDTNKARKFSYRPALMLIDGGQPQVNAAARALAASGVQGITVAGIAKRLEELWLPGSDFPVILPRASDELFLVQRIRDEAHRFAITHQRQKRSGSVASQLAEIPGLGEKRISALLKHFGSVKRLKQASTEEIAEVVGIGPILAQEIVDLIGE